MSRSVDLFLGENPASSLADLTALRALAALRGKARHSAPRVPRDLAAPLLAEQIVETWKRRRPRSLRLPLWPGALARVPGFGGRGEVEAILRLLPPPARVRVLDGSPLRSLATLFPDSWRALAPRYERALRDLARERRWEPIEVVDAFLLDGTRLLLDLRPRSANCYAGIWDTPGGKLEAGEDLETALKREISEELGISAGRATLLARFDHRDPTSGRHFRHWTFLLRRWRGRIRPREGQVLRWVPLREIRALGLLNTVVRRVVDRHLLRRSLAGVRPRRGGQGVPRER